MEVIKRTITVKDYTPEILIAVYPEVIPLSRLTQDDLAEPMPFFCLVYRLRGNASEDEFLYEFVGCRVIR